MRTWKIAAAALILVTALFLSGCKQSQSRDGGDVTPKAVMSATPTVTVTPSPIPSPTPTPDPAPSEYTVSKLYTKVNGYDNLYDMTTLSATVGDRFVSRVMTEGNYILVQSYDMNGDMEVLYDRMHLALQHLGRPDLVYEIGIIGEEDPTKCVLLEDGRVVVFADIKHTATIYNRELAEEGSFSYAGRTLGVAKDGTVWTCGDELTILRQYSLTGEEIRTFDTGIPAVDLYYVTTVGNEQYFSGTTPGTINNFLLVLDATDGTCRTEMVSGSDYNGDWRICMDNTDRWCVESVGPSPVKVVFNRRDNEYSDDLKEEMLLTSMRDFLDTDDGMFYHMNCTVYNFRDGLVTPELNLDALTEARGIEHYDTILLAGNGCTLLTSKKNNRTEFYLWEYSAEQTKTVDGFYPGETGGNITPLIDELICEIEERFGITVYYREEDIDTTVFDYRMSPMKDEFEILNLLDITYRFLSVYPEGFWQEILGNDKKGTTFYLCEEFTRMNNYSIENAAAVTNVQSTDRILMGMCYRYVSTLQETLAHETMHIMENRIDEYEEETGQPLYQYWVSELNDPDRYPYFFSYTDDDGNTIIDISGTYLELGNDAWFIDSYARSNYLEDRARIMENLFAGYDYYFEAKHLRDKAEFLCAEIRAVFPSIGACEELLRWEKHVKLRDLKSYQQEFDEMTR